MSPSNVLNHVKFHQYYYLIPEIRRFDAFQDLGLISLLRRLWHWLLLPEVEIFVLHIEQVFELATENAVLTLGDSNRSIACD